MAVPAASVADTLDPKVLLSVLAQVKEGDFTARMPLEWTGVAGKVADGLNDVIMANQALGVELARVSQVVGKEGRLSQRLVPAGSTQSWSASIGSVNSLIDDLVRPTIEMQRVIGAVADGDLSKKVSADVRGEMLELKNTINAMVDQLNGFISEVTRVAFEVGTEGKLGQAEAVTIEVGGVWKDLTDNVNLMAGNLTGQMRNIAEVTTAVANGDLSKKISIDVKGEFLVLKNTVNGMVDQLNAFAGEVTRVAREVGVEGKLGGQAQSKEVAGVWKDLTDNVNQLAANLTNQVRAISEVATAVTEGDLTRQVSVEASGEVAVLKDRLNEMIRTLRETTRQNIEQDWLKTNRERFTRMLQGQDDLTVVSSMILSELASLVSAQHGVFYSMISPADGSDPVLELQAGYGYEERKHLSTTFRLGEGLVGQCAKEKKRIMLTDVPGDYVRISSGLGESTPFNIIVLPVLFEGSLRAVIELASFSSFSVTHQTFLDSITESIGIVLSTLTAAGMTESLLKQSQSQAEELRAQQEELRESNEDLGRQAKQLAEQNIVAEQKNQEVEQSKRLVEEKVNQLAVSSKYKSEFIANMSHELRTPLNSLLILAEQLESNPDDNMTDRQVAVRERHPLVGQGIAGAAQQHPRPGQGRVGDGHGGDGLPVRRRAPGQSPARVRARRPGEGPRLLGRIWPPTFRRPSSATSNGSGRSSRTSWATRSSSPSVARSGWRSGSRSPDGAGDRSRSTRLAPSSLCPSPTAASGSPTSSSSGSSRRSLKVTERPRASTGAPDSVCRSAGNWSASSAASSPSSSTPGQGSTFTVYLPSEGTTSTAPARSSVSAMPAPGLPGPSAAAEASPPTRRSPGSPIRSSAGNRRIIRWKGSGSSRSKEGRSSSSMTTRATSSPRRRSWNEAGPTSTWPRTATKLLPPSSGRPTSTSS